MRAEATRYRKCSQLLSSENNPRKISDSNFRRLCDSIRMFGFWEHRPIAVVEKGEKYEVICGNQRLKAARKCGIKEVPTVCYFDIGDEDKKELMLRDNINNGDWDIDALTNESWRDVDFDFIGLEEMKNFHYEEPDDDVVGHDESNDAFNMPQEGDIQSSADDFFDTEEDRKEERDNRRDIAQSMLKDVLYESDNIYEIPNLLLEGQAGKLELPFTPWGANSRLKKDVNTYHFYVDDYRFEQLWKDPINLVTSGCHAIVEPNCSLHGQTPVAYGMHMIYRKRWLARYLQECGVKVYVDLNVSHKFAEYNAMGVPKGYNAFFTRGTDGWTESLKIDLEIAQRISGLERPNLCVYGGGKTAQEFCMEHGLLYVTDYINKKNI